MSNGFIFIDNPNFEDFVVANVSFCAGGRGLLGLADSFDKLADRVEEHAFHETVAANAVTSFAS